MIPDYHELRHSAGPWKKSYDRGQFIIESPMPTKAIRDWQVTNGESRFKNTVVARITEQTINGSGEKYGPKYLIDSDESEANARLMTAAPVMLMTLYELLNTDLPEVSKQLVLTAIRQATGTF